MFSILPLLLIIVSLGIIIAIIVRRYPQLILLDLETLPEREQKKKKRELFTRRAKKRSEAKNAKLVRSLGEPLGAWWKKTQETFRRYTQRVWNDTKGIASSTTKKFEKNISPKQIIKKTQGVEPIEVSTTKSSSLGGSHGEDMRSILQHARRAVQDEAWEKAEALYIKVIRQDTQNIEAYEGLGDVYLAQGQRDEAKETYVFLAKLAPNFDAVRIKLGHLAEEDGDTKKAIEWYQEAVLINDSNAEWFAALADLFFSIEEYIPAQEALGEAVELAPTNKGYLDKFVETSILVQDISGAEEAYQKLRMQDSEYVRLPMLRDKIDQIGVFE